jgi:hypothetical protein
MLVVMSNLHTLQLVMKRVRAEVRQYNSCPTNVLLTPPNLDSMEAFSWSEAQAEIATQMPTFHHAVMGALTKTTADEDKVKWYT